MDWEKVIERNRDDLLHMLALLFRMIGIAPGGAVATLPRELRCRVLRLLRPAESALRRLIVIAAREIPVPPAPLPAFATGIRPGTKRSVQPRRPLFALCDRALRVGCEIPKQHPAVAPRISIIGLDETDRSPRPVPSPDDPVSAARLSQRLEALRDALDDLPKQARRLARWRAKRRERVGRLKISPLRLGRPPGLRTRARHPIDPILTECHHLALLVMEPPDTS